MLFSLVKNENTQSYIYTNLILAWGGGGCIVACLKYILLMTASEAALYRIIWKKKINFLVICVKMN